MNKRFEDCLNNVIEFLWGQRDLEGLFDERGELREDYIEQDNESENKNQLTSLSAIKLHKLYDDRYSPAIVDDVINYVNKYNKVDGQGIIK